MSVQFGRWNFEGQPPAPEYIEKVSATLAPYGPDSSESYSKNGLSILYRAFHTTKESRRETQPHTSPSGAVITWDGRLDNRAELISDLVDSLTVHSTDVAIVAAAYERWGADCFAKLIGDWALSLWNPITRSLVLAKDPIGTRHLYYSFEKAHVTWSTILDPLVLLAGKTFVICEEYIAGWFAIVFPAAHLTPYVGIHSVPPSSSVILRPGRHTVSKYWDFDPGKKLRYRDDTEYEEHFRAAFASAVRRRLRSDRSVLADLSGGMDSSSIVCMADVVARGVAELPRLDTLSWYDDLDPDMDERPYFTKVEQKRGRSGCHIDVGALRQKEVGSQRSFTSDFGTGRFAATPACSGPLSELFHRYLEHMRSEGHRVTLSGIGGEEATGGGVPTPKPELQNLMARARFFRLVRQLNAWSGKMRKSRLPLLGEAALGFLFRSPVGVPSNIHPTPWFAPGFVRRNRTTLLCYPTKVRLFGALPSFQGQIHALNHARRFLAYCELHSELLRETRYPYLDRDLLEFVFAIPWEQLVRVGQRRCLMKRALVGIVPDELLNRKRKAGVMQESRRKASIEWPTLTQIGQHVVSNSLGIVDPIGFLSTLQKARSKEDVPVGSLIRTLKLESWLRHLAARGILTDATVVKRPESASHLETRTLHTSPTHQFS